MLRETAIKGRLFGCLPNPFHHQWRQDREMHVRS